MNKATPNPKYGYGQRVFDHALFGDWFVVKGLRYVTEPESYTNLDKTVYVGNGDDGARVWEYLCYDINAKKGIHSEIGWFKESQLQENGY